ncbi:phosphatase PAP2 family protein [Mesoplasma photuris]|uniref:phosphatase PAP2 family protein n=1 Tax=Mesoplasma photuris TaxID=217731 RepID=UPI00146F9F24|nr:phosphatase PAP2 family protein [Mesoplasma photuris]
MTILLLICMIIFVISSFFDEKIAEVYSRITNNQFVKFWIVINDEFGDAQFLPLVFFAIYILIESLLFNKVKENRNLNNIGWIIIVILIVVWGTNRIIPTVNALNDDSGFGSGIDAEYLITNDFKFISRIIICFVEGTFLIWLLVYTKLKLVSKDNFLKTNYWVSAIKTLAFIFFMYLIVIFLKISMGRPYYLNTNFEEFVGKITWTNGIATDITLTDEMLLLDNVDKQAILNSINNNIWGPAEYKEWYQPNGSFWGNIGIMLKSIFKGIPIEEISNPGYSNIDFPSGHTTTTFMLFGYGYFLQNSKLKNSKITKFLFSFLIIYLLSMMNSLVVARTHWMTDVVFSTINGVFWLFITGLVIDYIVKKKEHKKVIINKRNNRLIKDKNKTN